MNPLPPSSGRSCQSPRGVNEARQGKTSGVDRQPLYDPLCGRRIGPICGAHPLYRALYGASYSASVGDAWVFRGRVRRGSTVAGHGRSHLVASSMDEEAIS